ncbi:glycogen/starch/alpha-glucan phosphorylase [Gloeocapsopsis crepidinum LEGE 06123]|uniref:Alpha-1,4 glucan phosphorylase n=1 Tax=Gloeocapsopsis crepidinum LEGE 06123 TaxID=588587 RepID=A0ABR9UKJ7_9CHRO|nr:glycogen/starch/alpha-glucan phosphorylase [Gloeocapsopsis crepidinum]MBE9188784.1 glycogen/starch/alpha-glucan phosphorylase [Gloeocapsopsis crepidinum LEGE 06123]
MSESFEHDYRRLASEDIQLKNESTDLSIEALKLAFVKNLYHVQGKDEYFATLHDYYMAVAHGIRDRLTQRRIQTAKTYVQQDAKSVYYLSAEFLMGRHLGNSLINLGLYKQVRQILHESGLELDDLLEREREPGLGNGGLGRLAACFLDSLATLEIPAVGYGIRYEFGIFEQAIQNGWQREIPDKWLSFGNPWEIPRPDYRVAVKLGGHTEHYTDEHGHYRVRWIEKQTVLGIPYDTPVPGYDTNTVNTLRLWKAEASEEFNFQAFDAGDYFGAVANKMFSENISKVLYPNDNTIQGRELRLEQQYFFVSCSLQDIIRLHLRTHDSLDNLHEKSALQLNDTHPAIAIAELMRLLIDEHQMTWEQAWHITQNAFAYTNHTLLPEALERWSVSLFSRILPRHLEIIYEINYRFLNYVYTRYPGEFDRIARLSLIEEGHEKQVRMAHLACVGSHAINGVAALHTELLKNELLRDFYELFPEKFSNKTNGVTPRRWLLLGNPRLANLITEKIGKNWIRNLEDLQQLEAFVNDANFRDRWWEIKLANKQDLTNYIQQHHGIEVNINSLFDIQVKRMHEYKRQLLNVLHIITLYNHIKRHPQIEILPRTFIFGGKAAPGYYMAKLIIKLINSVADVVNHDPDVRGRLKVIFLTNYSVSLGQRVYAAADLSEQISTAGKEASGTGNMKFAMNGALTIGTLDGANVEIRQEVGADNFFLFGLTAEEVSTLKTSGYHPQHYYKTNRELQEVLQYIAHGYFSPEDINLFRPIVNSLLHHDEYLLMADYQSYIDCQEQVSQAYRDRDSWIRMSILNTARTGKFSSDRTIKEYCEEIWRVKPVKIDIDACEDADLQVQQPAFQLSDRRL